MLVGPPIACLLDVQFCHLCVALPVLLHFLDPVSLPMYLSPGTSAPHGTWDLNTYQTAAAYMETLQLADLVGAHQKICAALHPYNKSTSCGNVQANACPSNMLHTQP